MQSQDHMLCVRDKFNERRLTVMRNAGRVFPYRKMAARGCDINLCDCVVSFEIKALVVGNQVENMSILVLLEDLF